MQKLIKHIIYIIVGIIVLNIISSVLFFRIDFTDNDRYSLSKVSKHFIKKNTEPISVDFYITRDLPQDVKKIAKEFNALLKEYKSLNNKEFIINTIYPDTDEKKLQAIEAGIQPVHLEVRERDLEKIQTIYMGIVFKIGDQQSVIPFIGQDLPIEYEITRMLKQASDSIKPNIAFISGHGEASWSAMPQFIKELSILTDIAKVDLINDSISQYNVLCVIDPKEKYLPYELARLEQYLQRGGRLFIALNHAIGQLNDNQNNGFINRSGLEDMLEKKGLKINYDFVVDNNCGTIAVNQPYGFINIQSNVSFPFLPVITNFSKHAITQGLNAILLPFVSSIEQVKTSSTYIFEPLAFTSSVSGTEEAPVFFNLQKQWNKRDFNHPRSIVAALLTNEDNNSDIVAITDADFLINDYAHPLRKDNINFAVNSIEWLSDNTGLIKLRNKFTTFSSLQPTDEYTRSFLKYFNFLLPIIVTVIIAIVNLRIRRKKRSNRSHPGYID